MQDDGQTYTLRVTFLEIYNERITDLLPAEVSSEGIKLRPLDITGDDGKVSGLSAKSVTTADDVVRYLAEGDRRRRVGMTDWNERSSRSHSVFTVVSLSQPSATWSANSRYRSSRAVDRTDKVGLSIELRDSSVICCSS